MPTTEQTYQHFAKVLTHLLGNDTAIRLTVDGYMTFPQFRGHMVKPLTPSRYPRP